MSGLHDSEIKMKNTRIIFAGYLLFGFSFILMAASEPFFGLLGLITIAVGIRGRIKDTELELKTKHWMIIFVVSLVAALVFLPLLALLLLGAAVYLLIIPTKK